MAHTVSIFVILLLNTQLWYRWPCSCLAHIINLAAQVLISTWSKKPNSIQLIQKMDMSWIWQKWIAMRFGLFMQYASRYGLYLMNGILILSTFLLSGMVIITMQGTFQIGSNKSLSASSWDKDSLGSNLHYAQ